MRRCDIRGVRVGIRARQKLFDFSTSNLPALIIEIRRVFALSQGNETKIYGYVEDDETSKKWARFRPVP